MTQTDSPLARSLPSPLVGIALAGLAGLIVVSLALVVAPVAASRAPGGAHGLPPGTMLALVKIVALVYLASRVRRRHVYSLQWSSMFILLFVAEGVVRVASDPQPSAALGGVEAIVATIYFVAVLALLRPLKRRARASRR